jgi:hypothetical protein
MVNRMMKKEFWLGLLFSVAMGVVFFWTPQAAFSLVSYDVLSTSPIDASKWTRYESVRVIDGGKLRLAVRSATGSTAPVMTPLRFATSSDITKIEATITPIGYHNDDGANAMATVAGRFYNDGSSGTPGDCTGDVLGQVGIGNTPSTGTTPVVFWNVVRFTSADCASSEVITGGKFTNTEVISGTAYPVSMDWDGNKFIFAYNGVSQTYTPSTPINPPNTSFKSLYTRISNNAGKDGYISAYFDDIKVNGVLYDDFTADRIDQTKWANYEFVRAIKDDEQHLVLLARGTTNSTTFTENVLPIAAPETVGTLQATVVAHTLSSSGDAKGRHALVGVGGRFFNDGTAGDGYVGDIGATAFLRTTPEGLRGRWKVMRFTGTDDSQAETIAQGDSKKAILLDKPYTLSVSWDGTKFTFVGNKETFTYTPPITVTANATNAKAPWKGLMSAISDSEFDATAQGYFTNVMVGNAPHFLTVGITGSGSVKSSPAGITCTNEGGQCSKAFPDGKKVTLTAKAATGWVFQNWSGSCAAGAGKKPCIVTVNAAKNVTANFISSPTLFVAPATKKFGNVKANSKTSIATFTVTNKTTKGAANLVIGAIALTGNTTEFRVQNDNCSNQTVVPNGKCTFKAVFQPLTVENNKAAVIAIPSNDLASPANVQLTGNGTAR